MKKIFQKFLSIALAVTMVTAMMPKLTAYADTLNWKDSTDESWYSESGVNYKIGTAQQLADFAKRVNGGTSFTGKTVTLTSDIDLAGRDWTPIGTVTDKRFMGTFDGQAHVISNLTIGSPENPDSDLLYLGLFGYLSQTDGAAVRQVGIENVKIYSSLADADAGGLVGLVTNASTESKNLNLEKTYVTGGIYASGSGSCAGGGIGKANISFNGGAFYYKNSYASCDVSAKLYAGGAVGYFNTGSASIAGLRCNRDKKQTVAGNEVAQADRKLFGSGGPLGVNQDTLNAYCLTASEMETDAFLCNSSVSSDNYSSINYSIYYNQIGFGLREGKNGGLPILKMLVKPLGLNDTFTDNNINYKVTSITQKTVVVTGTTPQCSGAVTIPETVTYGEDPYSVTGIGASAFSIRTDLTAVTIPSSVTSIAGGAFNSCSALTSVTFEPNSQLQSIGDSAFGHCTALATINLDQTPQLTSIGQYTFSNCTNLSEVNIGPDSKMSTIGDYAFCGCTISSISIPSGVTSIGMRAFNGCASLTSVDFGQVSQLTTIGYGAFSCDGIANITIPAKVSSIGDDVFWMDNNLTKITVDPSNQAYCDINGVLFNHDITTLVAYPGGLEGAYTIPDGVTKVSDEAIRNCKKLTALTVPAGVTTLGLACLRDNDALTDVTFLGDVPPDSISRDCFAGYTTPVKVHVPAGKTSAYTTAFQSYVDANQVTINAALPAAKVGDPFTANGIKYEVTSTNPKQVKVVANAYSGDITIPAKVTCASDGQDYDVTEIGDGAFRLCFNLHSVSLPSSLTAIGDDAFMASPITGTMTIPDGVTSIGKNAFTGCPLTGIVLPSNLAFIGDSAFASCSHLSFTLDSHNNNFSMADGVLFNKEKTSLVSFPAGKAGSEYTVPSGVTSIAGGAFYGTGLKKITLPSGITSIGDYAFTICSSLTDLTFQGSAPQTVGNHLFNNDSCPLTVHVPANQKSNYETAFTAYLPDQLKFEAASLPAPSTPVDLVWDGTTAKWGAVTGATGYTVKLYKDSILVDTEDAGNNCFYDFQHTIQQNSGSYTFTAIAKNSGGASEESAVSAVHGEGPCGTVSAFETLDDSVKNRSVNYGTEESALKLPDSLSATVNGSPKTVSDVHWSSNPPYTPGKSGTYLFTAKLPNGYLLADDVALPSITITVKAKEGGDSGTNPIVSGFENLSEAVKNRTADVGTAISSLNLPQKLKVAADGISGLWVRVSRWICNIPNFSIFSNAGTYTFTPVLDNTYHDSGYVDSGYTLSNGVTLPNITVTVQGSSSNNHSKDTGNSSPSSTTSPQTTAGTQVDTASNTATVTTVPDSVANAGGTAQISVTVPNVTGGTGGSLDTGKAGKITIGLPESAMVQQLSAKQNVDLTLSVPSSIAHQTNGNTAIDIPLGSNVFAAAKVSGADVVINIKDTDTQKLAYTWTFKGADLAKSTVPLTDVNIGMAIRLTTEVPSVNRLTPNKTGLVLMFDHSGVLPSTASLTFSAKEKGFKPGQKLYFYYYNPTTGQIDPQNEEYTVDANGNVTVLISHCSNYVLLPHAARTITLDTRSYTMSVGDSYITGVKLTGVSGAKIKAYSSTKGVADVTVLKNGNVRAIGKITGITYVMIDVYDSKNKFLTHASVRLTVKKIVKPNGNSARQFGIF